MNATLGWILLFMCAIIAENTWAIMVLFRRFDKWKWDNEVTALFRHAKDEKR